MGICGCDDLQRIGLLLRIENMVTLISSSLHLPAAGTLVELDIVFEVWVRGKIAQPAIFLRVQSNFTFELRSGFIFWDKKF